MAASVTTLTPSEIRPESRRLTGSQIIWDTLVNQGVEVVFGYPGGAIMPAYDALPQYPGLRHILVRHEQGAAHMADGFARASGGVGVAVATSGPGATNLVTGIANAMMDSIPIVCITGQVASTLIGSDAFQEVDITGITLPITKHNFLVTRAEDILPAIRQGLLHRELRTPGPGAGRHHQGRAERQHRLRLRQHARAAARLSPGSLSGLGGDRAGAGADQAAKRPMIFCGHGVIKSNAMSLLLEFVHKTNIPVALTLLGLGGFPATHERSLGMMGMHGEAWVNTAIQEADLIIALGMRFDDRVTGNLKTYAPNAKKIHVELDPCEINKNVRVDAPLLGDVREILRTLMPHVERLSIDEWIDYIDALKGDSAVRDIQDLPDDGRLFAAHVIHDLWRETQGRALVVTDVGQHQMWEAQYYKHDHPRKLITSGGAGTMGFALPAAMGARFACPGRRNLGDRRRRRLPDDGLRARDLRAGEHQGQHRRDQQRLPRHGSPVAAVFLRRALRGDADQEPRFREAGRGPRTQGHSGHQALRSAGGGRRRLRPTPRPPWSTSASSRRTAFIRWCLRAPIFTT